MTEGARGTSARTRAPARTKARGGAVLVTGVCGRLGKHVARVLHRERRVVGVVRAQLLGDRVPIGVGDADVLVGVADAARPLLG